MYGWKICTTVTLMWRVSRSFNIQGQYSREMRQKSSRTVPLMGNPLSSEALEQTTVNCSYVNKGTKFLLPIKQKGNNMSIPLFLKEHLVNEPGETVPVKYLHIRVTRSLKMHVYNLVRLSL